MISSRQLASTPECPGRMDSMARTTAEPRSRVAITTEMSREDASPGSEGKRRSLCRSMVVIVGNKTPVSTPIEQCVHAGLFRACLQPTQFLRIDGQPGAPHFVAAGHVLSRAGPRSAHPSQSLWRLVLCSLAAPFAATPAAARRVVLPEGPVHQPMEEIDDQSQPALSAVNARAVCRAVGGLGHSLRT